MSNGKKTDKPSPPASSRSDELITQKEYAARKGWSKQYVNQLVKQGRISLREGKIDPAKADAALSRSKDPARDERFRAPPVQGGQISQQIGLSVGGGAPTAYSKARTVREHYKALMARAEYEEKIGLLVSKREAEEVLFTTGRTTRDHFVMKARTIGEELAAEFGLEKRAVVLSVRKHVKDALHELARELREVSRIRGKAGAGDTPGEPTKVEVSSDDD